MLKSWENPRLWQELSRKYDSWRVLHDWWADIGWMIHLIKHREVQNSVSDAVRHEGGNPRRQHRPYGEEGSRWEGRVCGLCTSSSTSPPRWHTPVHNNGLTRSNRQKSKYLLSPSITAANKYMLHHLCCRLIKIKWISRQAHPAAAACGVSIRILPVTTGWGKVMPWELLRRHARFVCGRISEANSDAGGQSPGCQSFMSMLLSLTTMLTTLEI